MSESESLEFLATNVAILLKYNRARAFSSKVVLHIDDFVDLMYLWTLETATSAGLVGLLDRLTMCESDMDTQFKLKRFSYGVRSAIKSGHEEVLEWWALC